MKEGGSVLDEQVLGRRIQTARRLAGFTQQELCQKANLSYSTLTKIERGAIKSPSIFTVQAITGALGTGLDELLGGTSPALPRRKLSKTESGVSFVYFDVNGCLVRYYERAFSRIAQDYGIAADIVETAFWHYNDAICRGTMSISDFNRELAERLGVPSINWQQYYLAAAEPVPEMHELIRWAIEHYKVGLLTNIMPSLVSAMRTSGQLPNLPYDTVIDSSEVGFTKPDERIYEIAADQANVPVSEILLVDDTRSNLAAAEKLGWHVMLFDYGRPEESAGHIREVLEPAA